MIFIALIPKWQAYDEDRYFGEIIIVTEQNKIPGFSAEPQIDHPPLYYLLASPFYYLGNMWGESGAVFMIRLFGLTQLVLLSYIGFLIAKEVFPDNIFMHYSVPSLLVLNPQLIYVSGSVQADALLDTFCALLFWQGILLIKRGVSVKRTLAIATIIIGGLLTKQRFNIVLVSFSMIAILVAVRLIWSKLRSRGYHPLSLRIKNVALSTTLLSVTFLPIMFLLRNNNFYEWSTIIAKGAIASNDLHFRSRMFRQFWGHFGWWDIPLGERMYQVLDFLALLALAGIIVSIIAAILDLYKKREKDRNWNDSILARLKETDISMLLIMIFFISSIILSYAATGYYDAFGAGSGGRYNFIVAVPIIFFMSFGMSKLVPSGQVGLALTSLFGGFFLFDLLVIYNYIVPFYY